MQIISPLTHILLDSGAVKYPQAWQVHEELSDGCRQISEVVALNSPKGNNNENM